MVFGWLLSKDSFYNEQARTLVQSASIFAKSSSITIRDNVPLIDSYFKTNVLSTDPWDFYVTTASVGTAFITIADYVPGRQRESVCMSIGEELTRYHPKSYPALENLSGLLHNFRDAGIPFHNAVGNWLSINLLKKDKPGKEDIEAFSIVGALVQETFGGWFKKK